MNRFTALLGNVLHFHGKWQGNCSLKTDFWFTGTDGKEKQVDAVDMDTACPGYCRNESVEAFFASYREEDWRYTFWGFLPENADAYDIEKLNFSNLKAPEDDYTISVRIPKFQMKCSMDMSDALKLSGVKDAFDWLKADFTRGFSFSKDGNVYLNSINQQTMIDFNEKGTEASSYTRIRLFWTIGGSNLSIHLNFDRPFYFLIWDEVEKLPLFVGQVFDPGD